MDWFVIIFIGVPSVIVVAGIYFKISDYKKANKQRAILKEKLKLLKDFSPNETIIGDSYGIGIAIDDVRNKICFIIEGRNDFKIDVLPYKDIISSEILEDGNTVTITKTNRGSQLGGALIGGVALGGVGALIGGLSGKTTSKETVVKIISLQITINRMNNPIHKILCADIETARYIHGFMEVAMKNADKDEPVVNVSITDELLKLAKLKEDNHITGQEFDQAKRKLLR